MRNYKATAGLGVLLLALSTAAWLLWPTALGGRASYVTTHGVSMQPHFHTGDLAIVRPASSYRVGDVVAYRSVLLHTVVMHRIVAVQHGAYLFKGDNNGWRDPQPVTRTDLIGKLVFRIPHGGAALSRATAAPTAALLLFVLFAGGGSHTPARRRKRGTMSRHARRPDRKPLNVNALPPAVRSAAAATAAVTVAGIGLAAAGWAHPTARSVTMKVSGPVQSMQFGYTAKVARTPAYDGTTVVAPEPVFRSLTNSVDVDYRYSGPPGSIAVDALVTAVNGWRTSLPLAAAVTFTSRRYDGHVRLDLKALDARAAAAAKTIGAPAGPLTITVRPTVVSTTAGRFTPSAKFTLSPLSLTAAATADDRTVTSQSSVDQRRVVAATLQLFGRRVLVTTARQVSAALLLLSLLLVAVLAALGFRTRAATEGAAIRRRYAPLLVPVAPMPAPAGRPLIDVADFATLARLADRYGLLVLHWSRSNLDTFIVQDDTTTYRYRTAAAGTPHTATVDVGSTADRPLPATLAPAGDAPR